MGASFVFRFGRLKMSFNYPGYSYARAEWLLDSLDFFLGKEPADVLVRGVGLLPGEVADAGVFGV